MSINKHINRNPKDTYIRIHEEDIDTCPDAYFEPVVAEYNVLLLYFITLSYDAVDVSIDQAHKNYCLLMDYDAYVSSLDSKSNLRSVISVPYNVFKVNNTSESFNNLSFARDIWSRYQIFIGTIADKIQDAEDLLKARLGVFNKWQAEKGKKYIEYKISTTNLQPKCYFVQEYFITAADPIGVLNLADPDRLFGHWYYPLQGIDSEGNDIVRRFGGKYLQIDSPYSKLMWHNRMIPENISWRLQEPGELLKHALTVCAEGWGGWDPYENMNSTAGSVRSYECLLDEIHESIDSRPISKVFISYASEDKQYVEAFADLLEDIGLDEDKMIFTLYPDYGIPNDECVEEWLGEELRSQRLHVFFLLSDNFYKQPYCLNEMGAAWAMKHEESIVILPGFKKNNIQGAFVRGNPLWIDLNDENELEIKGRLTLVMQTLEQEFGLKSMAQIKWERRRDAFLTKVKEIRKKELKAKKATSEEV